MFATLFVAYYELMNHDHYHLTHTPRGKCVIINIANFHKSTEVAANALSPRRGAERDAGSEKIN